MIGVGEERIISKFNSVTTLVILKIFEGPKLSAMIIAINELVCILTGKGFSDFFFLFLFLLIMELGKLLQIIFCYLFFVTPRALVC